MVVIKGVKMRKYEITIFLLIFVVFIIILLMPAMGLRIPVNSTGLMDNLPLNTFKDEFRSLSNIISILTGIIIGSIAVNILLAFALLRAQNLVESAYIAMKHMNITKEVAKQIATGKRKEGDFFKKEGETLTGENIEYIKRGE